MPLSKTRTVLEYIDMCESWMLDRSFDQSCKSFEVRAFCPLSESCSRMFREFLRIEGRERRSCGSRLRLRSEWCRRTRLSGRETIVFIIADDIDEIEITTTRVKKMPKTYPISISISSDHDDCQFRVRELHTGGEWDSSTMKCLSRIPIDILRYFS